MSIGQNYGQTLRQLTELYISMPDGPQKDEVSAQILQLSDMIHKLVDSTLDERIKEYKAATAALGQANQEIATAKADIAKVAKAIETTAKAISAVAKLLAALGLA